MKKKLTILLLAVIACFACAFGLSACGDDEQSGTAAGGNGGNTEQGGSGGIASLNGYEYTVKDGKYEITKVKDARITEAVIPDSVTSIAMDAFRGCTELKKLVIPDSVTYIGFEAFAGCENIEEVSCPASAISNLPAKTKLKTVNITSGNISDNLLKDCKSLTSLMISSGVTSIGDNAFSGCASLTSVSIPDSVTSIGNRAFSDCKSLTNINIPNSVTNIGDWAFVDCTSITSITIPNSVTSIGAQAFGGYSPLIFIIYCETTEKPNGWNNNWLFTACPVVWNCKQNDKDENGYAYAYIDGLRYSFKDGEASVIGYSENISSNLIIPEKVTYKNYQYKVSLGLNAFYNCSKLTSVIIPDSVTTICSSAFYKCSSLTSIIIPDSVTTIGVSAFSCCSSLTSVSLPNGITTIGNYAFNRCSSLTSINIPDSVTSIKSEAFDGCDKLIKTENGVGYVDKWIIDCYFPVTEVKLRSDTKGIADYAFRALMLTSISIPVSVTSIGSCAFSLQSSLTTINYGGTKEQWNEIIKGTLWDDNSGNYTVYCTDGQITKS